MLGVPFFPPTQTCQATPRALRAAHSWLGECPACTASVDPTCSWGWWQWPCLPGPAAKNALLSPSSGGSPRRGISGHQRGLLGSATRLPGSCCCIASFLASSAGPTRSQVGICAGLRLRAASWPHRVAGLLGGVSSWTPRNFCGSARHGEACAHEVRPQKGPPTLACGPVCAPDEEAIDRQGSSEEAST